MALTRPPLTIAVASGKGGTGKTLVATNLAATFAARGESVALVDCDVEAPNDALFLRAATSRTAVVETLIANVDADACTACGACRDACAYGAVRVLGSSAMVFPEMCHGCGVCSAVCPTGAITEVPTRVGQVDVAIAEEPALSLVSGTLDVGEVRTPTVIRAARADSAVATADIALLDSPPGVSCAAVAAVRGADALVLVTEPTPFGLHDLELSYRLGRDLGIPVGVIVNRVGMGNEDVGAWCEERNVPVLAHIPFDREVAEIYARGELLVDADATYRELFAGVADAVERLAGAGPRQVMAP